MRFEISRASDGGRDAPQPVEGAVRERGRWYIDVPDLPALLELARGETRQHSIIVTWEPDALPEVRLYDDYVE